MLRPPLSKRFPMSTRGSGRALQTPFHSINVERMYERTYTWRAGPMGPVLRRIPIYRVTTLPNGKEVERLLVCEINGMHPGDNDWVETIVNAPQTKAERDQLLGVLETVRQRLEEQHDQPCKEARCQACSLLLESGLSQVLVDIRSANR